MSLIPEHRRTLMSFLDRADFGRGALFLDLDGVVLLEVDGRLSISGTAERGIAEVVRLGRPVVMNSLRCPQAIISKIGHEWMSQYGKEIPAILLNGSSIGRFVKVNDDLEWQEDAAFPILEEEIDDFIRGVEDLIDGGIRDMLVFFYPRDWREREIIWTPGTAHAQQKQAEYGSIARVVSWTVAELRQRMKEAETCMIFQHIDRPKEILRSYLHQDPMSFFTRKAGMRIDKASGMQEWSARNGVSPEDSIGAGDTDMDVFLSKTGLAVIVEEERRLEHEKRMPLRFRGVHETIWVHDPHETGELILLLAELWKERLRASEHP